VGFYQTAAVGLYICVSFATPTFTRTPLPSISINSFQSLDSATDNLCTIKSSS